MIQSNEIQLEPYELSLANYVGKCRQQFANHLPDKHGFVGNGEQIHILGAMGEIAVAKFLGIYWGGHVNTFKNPDVGHFQVRCRSEQWHDLIIRPDDDNNSYFVLVLGNAPRFSIGGFILAQDGKQRKFLKTYGNRPAAYFVPQASLRPASELKKMIDPSLN